MATRERPSKLRWLAVLMTVAVLGCDPAAETDAGAPDSGFDASGVVVDAGFDAGPPEAELTSTPALQDFGDVLVDDVSSSATFTVTNSGGRMSNAISATIGGGDAGDFRLGADTCTGAILAAAETCTIAVTFEPTTTGSESATLSVADGLSTAIASLEGNGQTCLGLRITPTPLDFGSTTVGTATTRTMFTVEELGCSRTGTLAIVVGGADASQFTLGVDNCTGTVLALTASCTVEGIYAPTMPGAHTATIEATASPGGTVSAAVSGITPAALELPPGMHDFGSSPIGTATGGFTFTMTNTGGAATGPLTVALAGANPADFPPTAGGDSCSGTMLPTSGTCTVAFAFNPTATGARSATLRVAGTPGGMTTATLTGTGT